MRYELIIYWSKEDNSFVVEVPDGNHRFPPMPTCHAIASASAEAVANAQVVIDEWVETARELGRPIPEPRGKLVYA